MLRGLTAGSARDVIRLCRMVRRLETLADEGYRDPLYCNSRIALWDLAESAFRIIVRRDGSLRAWQTIATMRRIVADGV